MINYAVIKYIHIYVYLHVEIYSGRKKVYLIIISNNRRWLPSDMFGKPLVNI